MKRVLSILSLISFPIWAGSIKLFPLTSTLISGDYRWVAYREGRVYAATRRGLEIISEKGVRLGTLGTPGDAVYLTLNDKYAYIADSEDGLFIADISNPMNPKKVTSYKVEGNVQGVVIAKNRYALLVCKNKGLKILDISSPAHPREIGEWEVKDIVSVETKGDYLYLLGRYSGLQILNISSFSKPSPKGKIPLSHGYHLTLKRNILYAACGSDGLIIFNVSDPSNPKKIGEYRVEGGLTRDVVVKRGYAFIANGNDGLRIVKVSNPSNPQEVSHLSMSGAISLDIGEKRCFIATGFEGIKIIDITHLSKPERVKIYKNRIRVYDIDKEGEIAAVACGRAGLKIIDMSKPSYPMVIGELGSSDLRRVIIRGWLVYALDYYTGVKVIDSKDPENPRLKYRETYITKSPSFDVSEEFIATVDNRNRLWILSKCPTCPTDRLRSMGYKRFPFKIQDIAVGKGYIFIAAGDSGVRVVCRKKPKEVGSFTGEGFSQKLKVDQNKLYVGTDKGLYILDITDPIQPIKLGEISLPAGVEGMDVKGNLLFIAWGRGGIKIVDVSNPHRPKEILNYNTPGEALRVRVYEDLVLTADRYSLEIFSLRE